MASYVVMEPPRDRDDDARLVRDGFHLFAFLVPFLWLLWHRLWIEAALVLAAALAIAALGSAAGFGEAAPFLSLLVSIYVGLEGAALLTRALARRGWREWGVVEGGNRSEAETRYVAESVGDAPDLVPAAPVTRPGSQPGRATPSAFALGMLSYPGRR